MTAAKKKKSSATAHQEGVLELLNSVSLLELLVRERHPSVVIRPRILAGRHESEVDFVDVVAGAGEVEVARYRHGRTPVRVVASLDKHGEMLFIEARAKVGGRLAQRLVACLSS